MTLGAPTADWLGRLQATEVEVLVEVRADAAPTRSGDLAARLAPSLHAVVVEDAEARVAEQLALGVGDRAVDLVVDDGSHRYGAARTTFEVCFPRLRPGGRYVLAGWAWAHAADADPTAEQPALTNLVVELAMAAGSGTDVVRELRVDHDAIEVVRGDRPLPSPFRLATAYRSRGIRFRPLL